MEAQHRYRVEAGWAQGRGQVAGDPKAPLISFAPPPEFHGVPGLWTPEHFFVAAVATCFITTFRAIAEFSRFPFETLQVSAEGVLEKAEGGFRFTRVLLHPALTLAREEDRERGLRLLEKAERSCLVSRSLQSSVELQPVIQVAEPAAH